MNQPPPPPRCPIPPCGWQVLAATVRGSGHRRSGDPCQDAHQWLAMPPDLLVAAIADGAGSAPLGSAGASLASGIAIDLLFRMLRCREPAFTVSFAAPEAVERLLRDTVAETRAALAREAVIRGAPLRDLATTLLLVFATPQGIALAQIGDGALVVRREDDTLACLSLPGESEHINETVFLTAPDAVERLRIVVCQERVAQWALFSDGLQLLALRFADFTPHDPFFRPLLRFAAHPAESGAQEQLAAFLQSPRMIERTDDDLTLLLASRAPDP